MSELLYNCFSGIKIASTGLFDDEGCDVTEFSFDKIVLKLPGLEVFIL